MPAREKTTDAHGNILTMKEVAVKEKVKDNARKVRERTKARKEKAKAAKEKVKEAKATTEDGGHDTTRDPRQSPKNPTHNQHDQVDPVGITPCQANAADRAS